MGNKIFCSQIRPEEMQEIQAQKRARRTQKHGRTFPND